MKNFDEWNKKKKNINHRPEDILPKRKEVWWTSIGVNIGDEEDGKNSLFERPVLVIKVFNRNIFLGIPMTGTEKSGRYYYKIRFLKKDSYLILSQIRLFSTKRILRKIYKIDKKEFYVIMNQLKRVVGFK